MLGLMKKDLFLIKNNKNLILIAFIMVIFFGVFGDMDISFILPFMVLITYMSSFSYDEYNNFNSYVCTLPNGRENVVNAKYLLTIILTVCILIIGFIITMLTTNLSIEDILLTMAGATFTFILMVSVLYPLLFKYGAEKGRIALLVGALAIGGLATILMKSIDVASTSSIIKFFDAYGLPLMIIISIVALVISYFTSKKIYLKKEF